MDVHRKVDPDNDRLFTWWAPWRNLRARNMGWRLDYIAASTALVDDTVVCAAYRDFGTSDHGPVIAHLRTRRRETAIDHSSVNASAAIAGSACANRICFAAVIAP
jgi:hypothetical protein